MAKVLMVDDDGVMMELLVAVMGMRMEQQHRDEDGARAVISLVGEGPGPVTVWLAPWPATTKAFFLRALATM